MNGTLRYQRYFVVPRIQIYFWGTKVKKWTRKKIWLSMTVFIHHFILNVFCFVKFAWMTPFTAVRFSPPLLHPIFVRELPWQYTQIILGDFLENVFTETFLPNIYFTLLFYYCSKNLFASPQTFVSHTYHMTKRKPPSRLIFDGLVKTRHFFSDVISLWLRLDMKQPQCQKCNIWNPI